MYLQLYQVKKHLNIDDEFKDDDEYLVDLIKCAEVVIEKHIDNKLVNLLDGEGELPSPLQMAMLLLIANFYANREPVSFAQGSEVPLSYNYLLDLYKNYNNRPYEK